MTALYEPHELRHAAPPKPRNFVCPDHREYGCKGVKGKRKLKLLRSVNTQWGCMVTRHDVYRCRCCRQKWVSTNGGRPQLAVNWI